MKRFRARAGLLGAIVCAGIAGLLLACTPDAPEGGLPTHPSDRFSISLAWDAPTEDALGRPLTDLQAYRLHYSPSLPLMGPETVSLDVGSESQITVDGLAPGRYFFGVTALDQSGNESDLSDPLEVEVGP